jgi:Ca-activated chloride channel family protein
VGADGVRLIKRHPSDAADIFAGQDYVLLTRYSGSGTSTIRFEGRTASGPVSWSTRVALPSSSRENSFVARLWATQRVGYLSAEKRKNGGSREIDAEIRELGEKYSIPTEFTSYLVLEPGMRRDLATDAGSQLNNVVVTGVATQAEGRAAGAAAAPPPAVSAPSRANAAFESARTAAKQRSATNMAAVDEMAASSADTRRVGSRTFVLRSGVWTEARRVESMKIVRVQAFSAAYFELMDTIPELREVFALGDRVHVTGREIAIEITSDGSQSLSDSELASIKARW